MFFFGVISLIFTQYPFYLFPFSLFALVPLLVITKNLENKKAFFISFLYALPFFYIHLNWLYNLEVGKHLGILLIIGVSFMIALRTVLFSVWFLLFRNSKHPIVFGLSFTIYEWIISYWLFDLALPWANYYYTSLGFLTFAQISSIFGPHFISFILITFNYALFLSLQGKTKLTPYSIIIILVIVFGIFWQNYKIDSSKTLKIAVIQPNVLPRYEYDPDEWRETRKNFSILIDSIRNKDYDLLVLSESAIPGIYPQNYWNYELVMNILRSTKRPILMGNAREENGNYYNTALLIDTTGKVIDYYDKVHIVPFGENLPFYEFLPDFIRNLDLGQGSYKKGEGFYVIDFKGYKIGIMICYESIFPHISKSLVNNGAQVLFIITNDGWFGPSTGPREHYLFSKLRAIETGKYIIRSAKTGISAVVDDKGKALKEIPLFELGYFIWEVPLNNYRTIYTYIGESWILLLIIFFLILHFKIFKVSSRKS
ncbi:MAG: apolipoprotein N-acyltransferase [candidate division WOR-3 bacterium]|nr:apolipoprotein N-acyltransferase [candidate division WOR-3 bacterium]MCX7947664.1 apolipoprotein N-acyltransferase [candidate division WOR-3 bacterium]MDW8150541.1 apolipoprotein N-acyltransferase [candidate division WOR-3 bacterium]